MARPPSKCPICTKAAKHAKHTVGDFSEIACKECGHFRVSTTLLQAIRQYGIAAKRAALRSAQLRAPYGALPLVTTYDV